MSFALLGPRVGIFSSILVKTRQTTQTKKPRHPRDSIATQRWVGGAFQRGLGVRLQDAILGSILGGRPRGLEISICLIIFDACLVYVWWLCFVHRLSSLRLRRRRRGP